MNGTCEIAGTLTKRGEPECGAAAVICFEWLQRPENVIAGHIKRTSYRTGPRSTIRIEHHKTGAVIDHPLEERLHSGEVVKFYEEAEAVLAKLARRDVPMILREVEEGVSKPYSFSGRRKIVQRMRTDIGLPKECTLDTCRHGGMTELEEAELTEGQSRATRKRHAHMLANQAATDVQNAAANAVQNDRSGPTKIA